MLKRIPYLAALVFDTTQFVSQLVHRSSMCLGNATLVVAKNGNVSVGTVVGQDLVWY